MVDPPSSHWRDASVGFAAKAWGMVHKSIPMAARAQRVIFDKLWFSWNIAKGVPGTEVVCPLCEQPDSLAHLIQLCPAVKCTNIRNEGLEAITGLAISMQPASKWLSDTLVQLATDNAHGSLVYTGMWNSALRDTLNNLIIQSGYIINDELINQWRSALGDISSSFVLLTRALIADRIAGPDGITPDTSVGERITDDRRARTTRRNKEKGKISPNRNTLKDDNLGRSLLREDWANLQGPGNSAHRPTRIHTNACNTLK